MKHLYQYSTMLFSLLGFSINSSAQTTNLGTLYVNVNTQFSVVNNFNNADAGEFYNDGETFIYRNFNNDGIINYYENTGLIRFLGAANQEISGSQESYFYNTEFNNQSQLSPFHLSGDITIEGESSFLYGIIDNDNYGGSLFFGENSSHINTSNNSHVDGRVGHYGAEDFIFPIGDGGFYRYAGTSELSNEASIIESKYILENSDALYPHHLRPDFVELINDQEYWIIENTGNTEDTFITLSWNENTTPAGILHEPREGSIHIVRWDVEENRWIDEGGIVSNDNQTVSTVVKEGGVFTLARMDDSNVLPCQITVYNAVSPNNDGVNDYLKINTGASNTCTENLQVEVYNRWGVKVFETDNYGEDGDLFDGFSNGRLNIEGEKQLPTGTYFYILKFDYTNGNDEKNIFKKAGYLYLNGN
ncbi:gliding motility-associated C-terminal domain-containing protein [Salinimicrobium sp. MT39]|uniref:Gliding motility-associated C-terminal domain-containing protein n=1 Tax=Salinimicrobium profundisediminis TaxID=2994553 RepID=A0A9X3CXC5_9FLAO|nr:gliding motility-associated C-terminal domain-containing protein [Salinimicrobium profundisediminis]MCX2838496.1 gliding motility-associated C-terminal domain-containing protein [Salinimicrobium profundisediminis]